MVVATNGFPKCGNHALVKAVQLLGLPCKVNHIPFGGPLPDDVMHHLFIKRDPRNVVLSWLRFHYNVGAEHFDECVTIHIGS